MGGLWSREGEKRISSQKFVFLQLGLRHSSHEMLDDLMSMALCNINKSINKTYNKVNVQPKKKREKSKATIQHVNQCLSVVVL